MDIDVENATRDELVAFYNETLAGDSEKISPAISKVAAQTAVKAALEAAEAAEAELVTPVPPVEDESDADADALVEELHGTPDTPAWSESALNAAIEEVAAQKAAVDKPEVDDSQDYGDDFEDEEPTEFECNTCGDNGLIPRCPYCGTERRS